MKTKQLFASLLTLTLALLFSPKASANSAPKFWRGSDAVGNDERFLIHEIPL